VPIVQLDDRLEVQTVAHDRPPTSDSSTPATPASQNPRPNERAELVRGAAHDGGGRSLRTLGGAGGSEPMGAGNGHLRGGSGDRCRATPTGPERSKDMRALRHGVSGLVLLAVLTAGASAQAASRTHVNITLHTILRRGASFPNPRSSAAYAGTVRSKRLGRGQIVLVITITAHRTPSTFKFSGTSTSYYTQGTLKANFTGVGTVRSSRLDLAGHGDYTGGTLHPRGQRSYSFTGVAPAPPPPASGSPCAVPAGWKVVAEDGDLVVIEESNQPALTDEDRYCSYGNPRGGFRTLFTNDEHIQAVVTGSKLDGVASDYILYDTATAFDSPACGGPQATEGSSVLYAVNAVSGQTETLGQGAGAVTAAGISAPGVAAWILTADQCPFFSQPNPQRSETLQAFSFRTGSVTTLDSGDPGEAAFSSPSLASLQLYQCAAGCSANTVEVAWTHDGRWRYAQVS
jgi:hypothetical protein